MGKTGKKLFSIFGSANQLLAALALLAVAVWLKKSGKNHKMFTLPMTFMFIVTLLALIFLIKNNLAVGNMLLVVLLFILAIVLAYQGYKILNSTNTDDDNKLKVK